MTTEELQMELTVKGLTAAGGRRKMIDTLTSADESNVLQFINLAASRKYGLACLCSRYNL